MTLAKGWPHDPGENALLPRDSGPMTLAKGWPHDAGENGGTWPHEGGDWHLGLRDSGAACPIRCAIDASLGSISRTSAGRPAEAGLKATSPTEEVGETSATLPLDVPWTSGGRPETVGFDSSPPTADPGENSSPPAVDVHGTSAGLLVLRKEGPEAALQEWHLPQVAAAVPRARSGVRGPVGAEEAPQQAPALWESDALRRLGWANPALYFCRSSKRSSLGV